LYTGLLIDETCVDEQLNKTTSNVA